MNVYKHSGREPAWCFFSLEAYCLKKKKKLLIIWKSYYENRICSDLMGSPKLSNCIPSSLCCLGTIQKQGDCEWPDISKAAFLLILVIVLMFI